MSTSTRRIDATDRIRLAVTVDDSGPGTPVVCVHGYPDDHTVWDGVARILATARPVMRYDVRGSGGSDAPDTRAGYRLDQLAADLRTVLDEVSPDRPVHLVGHDWGSIQCWHALLSGRLAGRLASYTSISGPDLDLAARWLRRGLRTSGRRGAAVHQLLHSSYLGLFSIPVLPEQLWRRGILPRLVGGAHADTASRSAQSLRNRVNGLELYRANLLRGSRRPTTEPTDVPVLVIAPTYDRYVGVAMQTEAPLGMARNLRVATPDGCHWLLRDRPDVIATLLAEFVHDVDSPADGPSA